MKSHFWGNLPRFHLWIDVFLLNISYYLAGLLLFEEFDVFREHSFFNLLLVTNLTWVFCFTVFNLYNFTPKSYNSFNHLGKVLVTYDVHLILIELFLYLTGNLTGFKENLVFLSFEIFAFGTVITHLIITFLIHFFKRSKRNQNKYAIVGSADPAKWIHRFKNDQLEMGLHFCGMFKMQNQEYELIDLEKLIEHEKLDYLYCSLYELTHEQMSGVLRLAERKKTQIRLIPYFYGFQMKKVNFDPTSSYPAFHISTQPLSSTNERVVKRAFDITFSLLFLLAGLPVFLLLALMVKISSKGPVFNRQPRAGRSGKNFDLLSFRTHKIGSYTGDRMTEVKDLDLTLLGTFLRRSRLSDIPCFLNVLKGDMSIVGPQPLRQFEVDMLLKDASHDIQKVFTIKPGLTSMGQIKVRYANNLTENLHRLKYDMLYLNTYSWTKDLYLIYLTIHVILIGKGK